MSNTTENLIKGVVLEGGEIGLVDYDSLANKPTLDGKALTGELNETLAKKQNSIFYVVPQAQTIQTWVATHDDITEYYDGLMIALRIPYTDSRATVTRTLNINNLGAVQLYQDSSTSINYAFGSVVLFTLFKQSSQLHWVAGDLSGIFIQQNTSSKKTYLVGSQVVSGYTQPWTYSNSYIDVDGSLYINSEKMAASKNSVFYVTQDSATSGHGTWLATNEDIIEYYDGLTIALRVTKINDYPAPTTLNINGLGAKTIKVKDGNAGLYPSINTLLLLVYDKTNDVWYPVTYGEYLSDRDITSTTGSSQKKDTQMYLVGATSQSSGITTYSNKLCYIGTDNCLYSNGEKVALYSELSTIPKFEVQVVSALPTEGIRNDVVYLVPGDGESPDLYTEYIYVTPEEGESYWEILGSQRIDLSNYATKDEIPEIPATLPSPGALTIGEQSYDGSSDVDMTTIINALIDSKLGVIEDGSY